MEDRDNVEASSGVTVKAMEEESQAVQPYECAGSSKQGVLALAVSQGADPTVLSKLMDLQERLLLWCMRTDTDRPFQEKVGA